MNRLISFFVGIILLALVFAMIIVTALIYRANERSSIKSYIFQMDNYASQRVGEIQNINSISEKDLRNRLIKKYVSEYYKVIPGDSNVTDRPLLKVLSSDDVFKKWESQEAKTITDMSAQKNFRMVRINDAGISTVNMPETISYKTDDFAKAIYYRVDYDIYTWTESNVMKTEPIKESGTIYIEALFKPGIKPGLNVREYLKSGKNPVGLFMFKVTNVGNKEAK